MKFTAMVLMVSMLFASSVFASQDTPRMATAAGLVSSVDTETNALVVKIDDPKAAAREVTFVAADESKIIKDGAAIALAELKQGDRVTITYKAEDGKNVIVNIGVATKS
jgi:hypothetical protein